MNGLVRQIAVLSMLWAVCELLLPDGKQHQMVRMAASLLIMIALLTTVRGWLGQPADAQPVMTLRVQQASEETYRRSALTAAANQLESWCVNLAWRAGYQAKAAVWLTMEGETQRISLVLQPSSAALLEPEALRQTLAQQLGVDESCILLSVEEE